MSAKWLGNVLVFCLCVSLYFQYALAQGRLEDKLNAYPNLIVFNGNIVTMDGQMTRVQAMAVRDHRIIALGKDMEIKPLAGPNTEMLDAKGRMILPGLIDAHSHPHAWAIPHWLSSDWAAKKFQKPELQITYVNGDNANEIVQKVEQAVKQRAKELGPGKWIWITMFAKDNMRDARNIVYPIFNKAKPLLIPEMLDQWAPENPVMVHGPSLTAPSVNSTKAKEIMKTVLGKEVVGLRAIYAVPYEIILGGNSKQVGELLRHELETCFLPYGITTLGTPVETPGVLRALRVLDQKGELPVRWAWVHAIGFNADDPVDFYRWLGDFRGEGSEYLWNNGVGQEGWEESPWACTKASPLASSGKGGEALSDPTGGKKPLCAPEINYEASREYRIMKSALESGLRITFLHAYNDGTYDAIFNLLEQAIRSGKITLEQVKQMRIGLEHNMIVRPDQYEKLAKYGIMPSFQGYQLYEDIKGPAFLRQFGEKYLNWMMPVRSLVNAGMHVTFNTDAHLTPIPRLEAQPMDWPKDWEGSIWAFYQFFVTRKMTGQSGHMTAGMTFLKDQESVDRLTVIKGATIWGAERLLREKDLGSLEVGKIADFIVIDKDYFTIPENQIHTIKTLMTAVGGKIVYKADGF